MNDLPKVIRKEAATQGELESMSLWAGESVHLNTDEELKSIIDRFV